MPRVVVIKCPDCGAPQEQGKIGCPGCGRIATPNVLPSGPGGDGTALLSECEGQTVERIVTGFGDVNFGSRDEPGVPKQAVILLGGMQGSGKSRYTMAMLSRVSHVTGRCTILAQLEEPRKQVRARATDLMIDNLDMIRVFSSESLAVVQTLDIDALMTKYKPAMFVLDSMQYAAKNLDEQIEIAKYAKACAGRHDCPVIIVTMMTKNEMMAGSNELQHVVDMLLVFSQEEAVAVDGAGEGAVLRCEPGGEPFRCLETKTKNRFGTTGQTTWFEMTRAGLVVFDPDARYKEQNQEVGDDSDGEGGDRGEDQGEEPNQPGPRDDKEVPG